MKKPTLSRFTLVFCDLLSLLSKYFWAKIKCIGATLTVVSFAAVVWPRHTTLYIPVREWVRCVKRFLLDIFKGQVLFWVHWHVSSNAIDEFCSVLVSFFYSLFQACRYENEIISSQKCPSYNFNSKEKDRFVIYLTALKIKGNWE